MAITFVFSKILSLYLTKDVGFKYWNLLGTTMGSCHMEIMNLQEQVVHFSNRIQQAWRPIDSSSQFIYNYIFDSCSLFETIFVLWCALLDDMTKIIGDLAPLMPNAFNIYQIPKIYTTTLFLSFEPNSFSCFNIELSTFH